MIAAGRRLTGITSMLARHEQAAPRPASEAANCDPYAVAARDPAARSCTWNGRPIGCAAHGGCAVTAIKVCPEATILSRSVAEAQCPHARVAAVLRCVLKGE